MIQEIGHDEVAGVLERWDRCGPVCPATEILADLGEVLPRFRLAVDVAAGGLLLRLGLELCHAGSWSDGMDSWLATGRSDWRPVVERLARGGWCLPAKARGLREWSALDKMYDRRGVFLVQPRQAHGHRRRGRRQGLCRHGLFLHSGPAARPGGLTASPGRPSRTIETSFEIRDSLRSPGIRIATIQGGNLNLEWRFDTRR